MGPLCSLMQALGLPIQGGLTVECRQGQGDIWAESVPPELRSHFLAAQQVQRARRGRPAPTFRSTLRALGSWLCQMTWASQKLRTDACPQQMSLGSEVYPLSTSLLFLHKIHFSIPRSFLSHHWPDGGAALGQSVCQPRPLTSFSDPPAQ